MKRFRYPAIFMLLIMVYAAIALSPLAPLALKSPVLAHAITGECAGDCGICGCSPERSASHTCCCWMKKMREQEARSRSTSCCPPVERKSGCCSAAKEARESECCGEIPGEAARSKTPTVYRCTPCGKDKLALLWESGSYQHLPYLFTGNLSDPLPSTKAKLQPDPLTSRYQEPPDPPPKHILPA